MSNADSIDQPINIASAPPSARHVAALHFFMMAVAIVISMATIIFATLNTALAKTPVPVQLAGLVTPNDMNMGALLMPSKEPGRYVEAPRLKTDVNIDISGPIARVRVTQRFENPGNGWVEGIYVFPLPENSAVDALKMQIGDRFIEGLIKKRAEARQIYEQAKREGKKAALLEQQRPNIFTNAVANIGPNETIIVQIEYQQTVKQSSGEFSLRFPMVVAPRYSPRPVVQNVRFDGRSGWGDVKDPVPDREKISSEVLDPDKNPPVNPVSLKVSLSAGFSLGEVTSHHHKVVEEVENANTRILTLNAGEVPADRDFELTWKARGNAPSAALFKQDVDGNTYILAYITPPSIDVSTLPKKNRETIFIIDNSGSMAGKSIVQAKQALEYALQRMEKDNFFNVVRFDDTMEMLYPSAVRADRENIEVALRFVRGLEADGGTEMLPALKAALVDNNSSDTDTIRQVIFLTDGAIGNEQQLFDEIGRNRGRSRVFTVGIGSAPNSFFMTRAAEIGRGTFTHVGSESQVRTRMVELFTKLETPVMTNLVVGFNGARADDISPNPLPDLYVGEPVVIAARLAGGQSTASAKLNLRGEFAGQPWRVEMALAGATDGPGVGKLWARRKIASLEASRSNGADIDGVDRNIELVALNHHLVSRLTSLVAVDVTPSRPGNENLDSKKLPHNLPAGWEFDKVMEDEAAAPMIKASYKKSASRARGLMAPAPTAKMARLVAANTKRVNLPQTATPAERNIIAGLLILLFTLMLLLTRRMWGDLARIARS